MKTIRNKTFLTARWLNLAFINFTVDPSVLAPYLPHGTEIDYWNGKIFISIVGFHFVDTKVKGLSIPFHKNFEEVNLRFYVRRKENQEWKRGVVFIKEIVPKPAIAFIAKMFYNENYVSMRTKHSIDIADESTSRHVRYEWYYKGRWNSLSMIPIGSKQPLEENSEEAFITEHYWGYSQQKNGKTIEYQVEHPRWNIWQVSNTTMDIDAGAIYGKGFERTLSQEPSSAFLTEGSAVTVYEGRKI